MYFGKDGPRLFIFDADGTLRWTTVEGQPCPNKPDEWRLMPNVKERLQAIPWGKNGCRLGIASNQGGVAAGYLSRELAHRMLVDTVVEAIGYLPDETHIELCTCPAGIDCTCRKPAPGMLLSAGSDERNQKHLFPLKGQGCPSVKHHWGFDDTAILLGLPAFL